MSYSDPVDAIQVDIDGDRLPDIVEALTGGGLSVRKSTGKDTYADAIQIDDPAIRANRVFAGDFTSDGLDDLVAFREGGTTLWLVPSRGAAGFEATRTIEVAAGLRGVAFSDFDRNGGLDIAVATNGPSVTILSNADDRKSFTSVSISLPGQTLSISAVSLRDDLYTDLAVGLVGGDVVTLVNARGAFAVGTTNHVPFDPDLMTAGDVDLDGIKDVVVAAKTGMLASLRRVPGALSAPVVSTTDAPLSRLYVGMIDGDGRVDLAGLSAGMPVLFSGDGAGAFESARRMGESLDATSLVISNTRRSGSVDLVVARKGGSRIESVSHAAARGGANVIFVTNTNDITYDCDPMTTTSTEVPAPAGSLRNAVEVVAPSTGGPDIIRFSIPTSDIQFSSLEKVWYILLARELRVTDSGLVIDGDSQTDTNPFGPEIALIPLDLEPVFDPVPVFDGIDVAASVSGVEINGLIISNIDPGIVNFDYPGSCYDLGAFPVGDQFFNLIDLAGSASTVRGNYLGTDETGGDDVRVGPAFTSFLGSSGVLIRGNGNTIGGDSFFDRNIITYVEDGVLVLGATGTQIIGNVIGTDGSVGSRDGLSNPLSGVLLVGGRDTVIESNVISGNGEDIDDSGPAGSGILAIEGDTGFTTATTIARNKLGVDSTNQPIDGNNDSGILLNAARNTTIGPANRIANNAGVDSNAAGIQLGGDVDETTGTVISDNEIFANPQGITFFAASSNTVGPNNFIHDNTENGIAAASGDSNRFTKNSMTDNGFLGINLLAPEDPAETGITPNDNGDTDSGPNTLLNYPKFISSDASSGQLIVTGSAPANSVVEIFESDLTHLNGEGITFLTAVTCSTSGAFSAIIPIQLPVEDGFSITATATLGGNTSEFGPNFNLDRAIIIGIDTLAFPPTAVGSTSTLSITICNGGVSDLSLGTFVVTPSGRPFAPGAVPDEGAVLSPGECTSVPITFTPPSEGTFTANLSIPSDDPDGAVTIALRGSGVLAVIDVSTGILAISATNVGGTRSSFVTVNNPTDVPVNVTGVRFNRRGSKKVSFTSSTDTVFRAVPDEFTIPPRGSQDVQVFFSPDAAKPTTDKKSPFVFADPTFITPKTVQADMVFLVDGVAQASEGVLIKAKVVPKPVITSASIPDDTITDTLVFTLDIFDPDNNVNNAKFVFYNESLVELFRINEVAGIPAVTNKFANGINIPITFTFTGVADFARSLKFMDVVAIDASGNQTNTVRFTFVFINSRDGASGFRLVPVKSDTLGLPNPMAPFLVDAETSLPAVNISPRR